MTLSPTEQKELRTLEGRAVGTACYLTLAAKKRYAELKSKEQNDNKK